MSPDYGEDVTAAERAGEVLVWCPECAESRGVLVEHYAVRRADEAQPFRSFLYVYCDGCRSFLDDLSGAVA